MESHLLEVAVQIAGWIYFTSWTLSLYPQTYKNWKRKSVVGFSFDYLALSSVGNISYSIYTVVVYSDPIFKDYFHKIQHQAARDRDNTVKLTDVVYATHGLAICVVQLGQCFIYERGSQRVSRVTLALVVLPFLVLVVAALVAVLSTEPLPKWAWVLTFCGYVKSGSSFIMCVPQIYLHFKTKSTKGWHILGVWGDFTGGVFSVVQMLLCCIIDHDNAQLTGNIPKLILSTECLCFDAVFIFQHYIFYNYSNYRQEELTTKPLIINSEEQRSYDTFAKRLGY